MQIQISGQHLDMTDAIHDFVEKKLQKLEAHMHNITSIQVVLKVEKHLQIAEAQVSFRAHTVHAEASSEDLYKTVDLLIDKLIKQLIKYKEKMTDHR